MSEVVLADLHKRFGEHVVLAGLQLTIPAGSFTAILGPSGAGKTTLLRLLAGFERPDRGSITIAGRTVEATDTHTPPDRRRIGYVPQEGSLFPHLTVAANVAFGLPRAARRRADSGLLDLVGLGGLQKRYPHQLSGGQQQRVALARALAVQPDVVLLDEPFASLDAHLRAELRDEVGAILREAGTTTLLVTHNQDEALSAADLVAVLRDGQIVQHATPGELYARPADHDVARFIGDANLLDGTFTSHGGAVATVLGPLPARWHGEPPPSPCRVTALVRPEQIVLAGTAGPGTTLGRVVRRAYHGHDTLVHVQLGAAPGAPPLLVRTVGETAPEVGSGCAIAVRGPVLVWKQTAGSEPRDEQTCEGSLGLTVGPGRRSP